MKQRAERRITGLIGLGMLGVAALSFGGINVAAAGEFEESARQLASDAQVAPGIKDAFARPLVQPGDAAIDHRFFLGKAIFEHAWRPAKPHAGGSEAIVSAEADGDGLGPTYNAKSCAACHPRAGSGAPPRRQGESTSALIMRVSVLGTGGQRLAHPDYGEQINTRAVPGVAPEAKIFASWEAVNGVYGDGTAWQLRRPAFLFMDLAHSPMDTSVLRSPRVPPALAGLGLLALVAEADILARADADDANGDGISGRVNLVQDVESGRSAIGRFGWKAGQPTIRQQVANALLQDMGITTSLYPENNCPTPQFACQAQPNGGAPELDDNGLDALAFYSAMLRPPGRRAGPDVVGQKIIRRGEVLFHAAGCVACHAPQLSVGTLGPHDTIAPYTDLLLHDLGEGLADHRDEGQANGREWRTAPLWGIGLVQRVNGHNLFLHDGRARGLAEAVLWHGGEAEAAREAFRTYSANDRAALVAFLRSL